MPRSAARGLGPQFAPQAALAAPADALFGLWGSVVRWGTAAVGIAATASGCPYGPLVIAAGQKVADEIDKAEK